MARPRDDGVAKDQEIRAATDALDRVGDFGSPGSKCVPAVEARCPPAEKPMMPIRFAATCHWPARARMVRIARWASCNGAGWP